MKAPLSVLLLLFGASVVYAASSGDVGKPAALTLTIVAVLANLFFIPMFWVSLRRFLQTQDQIKDKYDVMMNKLIEMDKGYCLNIQRIDDSARAAHARLDKYDRIIEDLAKQQRDTSSYTKDSVMKIQKDIEVMGSKLTSCKTCGVKNDSDS